LPDKKIQPIGTAVPSFWQHFTKFIVCPLWKFHLMLFQRLIKLLSAIAGSFSNEKLVIGSTKSSIFLQEGL